jgi:DNA processing protein
MAESVVTVVSGLARGVDTIAHKSALNAGGRTGAVLGSGLDVVYPYENRQIVNRIVSQGLAAHPDKTAADFEAKAWPQLKPNLIEDLSQQAEEQMYEEYKRSPMAGAGF